MTDTNVGKRQRLGRVSWYAHHGSYYLYMRHEGRAVRLRIACHAAQAEAAAALLHARPLAAEAGFDLAELSQRIDAAVHVPLPPPPAPAPGGVDNTSAKAPPAPRRSRSRRSVRVFSTTTSMCGVRRRLQRVRGEP